MNKFINILLLLISFPTILFSIYVGFDMPIEFFKTTGQYLPYVREIFLGIGFIYFILIVRRSIRRWMGVKMVAAVTKFRWNEAVSTERKKRIYVYLLLEAGVMAALGLALINVCSMAWPPSLALFIGAADSIIFLLAGKIKNAYRIGLTSKALIVADREVKVLYLSGLRKVSLHQDSIFFDYLEELQLSFPADCIPDSSRSIFREQLEKLVNRDKVFFTESIKKM